MMKCHSGKFLQYLLVFVLSSGTQARLSDISSFVTHVQNGHERRKAAHFFHTQHATQPSNLQRLAMNDEGSGKEDSKIILPIRRSRSRSPVQIRTNQYGFIETNQHLPEKRRSRRQRETVRQFHRQNEQVQKVEESIRDSDGISSTSEFGSISLDQVEKMARGKRNGSVNKHISKQIVMSFQSARSKKMLEELAGDFISRKTVDSQGKAIALSQMMLPRDQTSIIRLLGAKGAYPTMLTLLRHLESQMDISGAQYAYTAAITSLAQAQNKKIKAQAIKLLDEMDEKGIPPNTYTLTAAFLAIDGAKPSLALFNRAKEHPASVEIGVHLYNSAIHACSRGNGWQTALSLFRQMPRDGVKPNDQTYASLIHSCAKSGQLKVALSVFDEMKITSGIPRKSANKIWGAALRACAVAGNGNKAMELIAEMIQSNVNPNTLHYNSVLGALAKEGDDDTSLKLLNHMQAGTVQQLFMDHDSGSKFVSAMPDLVSVNTVLVSFVKSGNYAGAKAFFERVKRGEYTSDGFGKSAVIRPDIISYNSILSACQDPKEATSIIKEIRLTRRNRINSLRATCVTYTNAIGVCKNADSPDLQSALFLLEEAKTDGIRPNVFMYSAAIWTAERCGDAKTAVQLLSSMRKESCYPNAVSYDGVLSCLAMHGKFESACSLFKFMRQDRIQPTAITFQKLALAAQKSDCSANLIVEYMNEILSGLKENEKDIMMSGPIYNSIIRAYGSLNDPDSALRVFESIDRVNAQVLSSILFVCSSVSPARWQDAIIILHTSDIVVGAAGRGRIEYGALTYAVIACAKENEWKEGLNLLDIYGIASEHGKQMASVDAVNSLIAAAGRSARPDIAIKILNESPKYGVMPNERSFRSAIVACNQAEHEKRRRKSRQERLRVDVEKVSHEEDEPLMLQWWEAALSLLRRMKEEGLSPDIQTYSAVISSCEAAGQWQRAIGILRTVMKADSGHTPNKFCFNAAIAACEKGGAWLEAVELYERMRQYIKPNFITLNSVLIALEKAEQKEMAESLYREALNEKVVKPWKWSHKNRVMDLHKFSAPMAKIAVRNVIDSLMTSKPVHDQNKDLVIIVGKGKGSEDGIRVLLPEVQNLLMDDYGIKSSLDETNSGRLRVERSELWKFSNI